VKAESTRGTCGIEKEPENVRFTGHTWSYSHTPLEFPEPLHIYPSSPHHRTTITIPAARGWSWLLASSSR